MPPLKVVVLPLLLLLRPSFTEQKRTGRQQDSGFLDDFFARFPSSPFSSSSPSSKGRFVVHSGHFVPSQGHFVRGGDAGRFDDSGFSETIKEEARPHDSDDFSSSHFSPIDLSSFLMGGVAPPSSPGQEPRPHPERRPRPPPPPPPQQGTGEPQQFSGFHPSEHQQGFDFPTSPNLGDKDFQFPSSFGSPPSFSFGGGGGGFGFANGNGANIKDTIYRDEFNNRRPSLAGQPQPPLSSTDGGGGGIIPSPPDPISPQGLPVSIRPPIRQITSSFSPPFATTKGILDTIGSLKAHGGALRRKGQKRARKQRAKRRQLGTRRRSTSSGDLWKELRRQKELSGRGNWVPLRAAQQRQMRRRNLMAAKNRTRKKKNLRRLGMLRPLMGLSRKRKRQQLTVL